MASDANLVDLISNLKTLSSLPESYFQPSKQLPQDTLDSLKVLFDFSRQKDATKENNSCPLNQLMIEGFDDEQIWQQIELQNTPVVSDIRRQLKQLKGSADHVQLLPESLEKNNVDDTENDNDVEFDDSDDDMGDADDMDEIEGRALMPASSSEDEDDNDNVNDNDDDDDDRDNNDSDLENNNNDIDQQISNKKDFTEKSESIKQKGQQKRTNKGSIVDDKFFKLSEMNEFLDKMDQQFERNRDGKKVADDDNDDEDDEDDDVDFFRDISSDEEEDDDGDEWGNVLGNTAKIMGR